VDWLYLAAGLDYEERVTIERAMETRTEINSSRLRQQRKVRMTVLKAGN